MNLFVSIGKKALGTLGAIVGASIVAFACFRAFPGDPVRLIVGEFATPKAYDSVHQQMGLDRPMYIQYWRFLSGFFKGDWGYSWTLGQSVREQVGQRLPASIELALCAFVLMFALAVLMALAATYARRYRILDRLVRGFAYLGVGTPPFLAGLFLLLVFSRWLNILPGPEGQFRSDIPLPPTITHFALLDAVLRGDWATFWDGCKHIVLPTVALALAPLASLVRILRANLLEVNREPFILLVRSKGISRWSTASRHALPNAFLPTLTVSGLILGHMIGSAVLVETVFRWPGIGALTVDSALRKDFALPQTFVLLSAFAYVVINMVVDLLYGVIDPRVRQEHAA